MRQVMVQVPAAHGAGVMGVARRFDAINMSCLRSADGRGREAAVVLLHVSNQRRLRAGGTDEELRVRVAERVRRTILERQPNVTPLVAATVLSP